MKRAWWATRDIRVVQTPKGWEVVYNEEVLSGPFSTRSRAIAAKREWMVVR